MRGRAPLLLAAALACAAPAAAQVPQPGEGSARTRIEPRPPARTAPHPSFEFRSSFWVNLHHFLYQQARLGPAAEPALAESADATDAPQGAEAAEPARFVPAKGAAAWNQAVEHYRAGLARRDLRLALELVALKNRLAELDGCSDLSGREERRCISGLRPELIAALEGAAAVYRAERWEADDRANREWMTAAAPLAERFGRQLGARLAQVYQSWWPAEPIRVDVVVYAGRGGSYATLEPLHVVIASADPRNQGLAALEVLFHEASHELAGGVAEGIARRCRALNKPIPRDLWHAVVYYTTGDAVVRMLAATGRYGHDYLPYGHRHGLYVRGWRRYLSLLEQHWQPYLDGRITLERALARLVAAL